MLAQKRTVLPFLGQNSGFFSNFGPQLAHLLEDLFGQTVWLKPMASRFQWYQIRENPGTGSPGYSTGKIGQFWPKINIFQFFKVGTFFINFCQNWPILDLFWLWLHIFLWMYTLNVVAYFFLLIYVAYIDILLLCYSLEIYSKYTAFLTTITEFYL